MKKIILGLSVAVSIFAFDKVLSNKEALNIIKATPLYSQLKSPLEKKEISLKATKKDGFYIVEIITPRGKGNIYITADKKYTIMGQVINNKTSRPLIPNFPKDIAKIRRGVMFSFGEGKEDLYLVTDPECPYCRLMEAKTKENLKKNYRVHVILMPLSFHKDAKAMSYYILAGKDDKERAKRLEEVLGGSEKWKSYKPTETQKAKFDEELKRAKKAADELGARGTPSVYDKDFNSMNWTTLGNKK